MNLDENVFLYFNQLVATEPGAALFSLLTGLGNGWILLALVFPAMYFGKNEVFRRHFAPLVLSVAAGALVVLGLKVAVNRPRPPAHFQQKGVLVETPMGEPVDRSFPSGHTQTAFGAAVYLSLLCPLWSPVFLLLALGVGVSRVALGVHFPSDVLGGMVIGMAVSYLGFRISARYWEKARDDGSYTSG